VEAKPKMKITGVLMQLKANILPQDGSVSVCLTNPASRLINFSFISKTILGTDQTFRQAATMVRHVAQKRN